MAEKTNISWADGTLSSLVGCYPVSPGCANCYAVGTCWTKKANPNKKISENFAGTAERQPNGLVQFTGKINFISHKLYAVLEEHKSKAWFVNSLSDLFYESTKGHLDESIILEHFQVFAKAYWQEFRALTKRPERMLAMDSKITWPANVQMGVSVESVEYLYRIPFLGKTHARHKFISFEPWLTPWPESKKTNIRQAFPLTIDGVQYNRLRDLLKASGIECSIVGGESSARKSKARHCGFDDIHYILDETIAAGAYPCLKQLGTKWAVTSKSYGIPGGGANHGASRDLWPQKLQKYTTNWPSLKLPKWEEK